MNVEDIHQEREVAEQGDWKLIGRLSRYALPYWKAFVVCIVLAFIVVAADIGRTYLIRIAIDDHINGYQQPMLAATSASELSELGLEPLTATAGTVVPQSTEAVNGVTDAEDRSWSYARAGWKPDDRHRDSSLMKVQIVQVQGSTYLVAGWLSAEEPDQLTLEHAANDQVIAVKTVEGERLPARALTPTEREAFLEEDTPRILRLGGLFLLAVIGAALLSIWQMNLLQFTGQRILYTIRDQLFKHIARMPMSFFDRNPVGRLVVRVTQDTESLNNMFTQVIVNLIKDVLVLAGIISVMFYMSVELTLLTLVVLPFLVILTFWYKAVFREAQRTARIILSRLNSFLAENLSGMRITQIFVRERRQWEMFHELNDAYYHAGMRGTIINSIFQPAIGLIGNLAVALLLWYGGLQVIDGTLTFGIVFAFTIYVRQFFNPLMSLAEKYAQVQLAMVGAERIFDLLDEEPSMVDTNRPATLPQPVRGEIRFEHVWFAYQQEEWVLKDVSFTIQPGQTIAFVGATGAGKSSIIQLINRFYDIQRGRILLDGVDIRDLPIEELRTIVGIVQQDVFLFSGTIATNIRLNETERISDNEVVDAAQRVNMDAFVRALPEGYDAMLGERGVSLSLGQRQLLSFARAIVFRPQVLILDEATSNIDSETESAVQEALLSLSHGRTTLIVAHRLSTIVHADQIIVMHKGKVREKGTHAELIAAADYYYRLHQLQYKARDYSEVAATEMI